MKKLFSIIIATTMLITSPLSFAADVEVTFTEPDKYRDIRNGNNGTKKNFESRVFRTLEEHWAKLAEDLPKDQKLIIDVTDIDLAGDVNVGGINQHRIVKNIFFPRIEFSYKLVDANGETVIESEIDLKDMSFMTQTQLKYRNDFLGYEKKMLDDWFRQAFKDHVVEKE